MNKVSKFLITGIAAFSLNAILSKTFAKSAQPAAPVTPQTGSDNSTTVSRTANVNLLLKNGSRGYEVGLLQQKLGVSKDEIFGSRTEAALVSATGVNQITLASFDQVRTAYQATQTNAQLRAKYEAAFPITKQVIATVDFEAFVAIYRNGNWFTTDLDGKQLPSVTFKKTAQVGAVYSSDYDDPSIIILALPYQVPHNVYNIPVNQTYNKIRVKASWIK